MSTRGSTIIRHKIIFALIVITAVLLIVWAGYANYRYVAEEKNATIMADFVLYGFETSNFVKQTPNNVQT